MNMQIDKNIQVFDLTQLGLLKVSGNGAAKLLQGQLSCNIDEIKSGGGTMGAHCNPQGRMISLFQIARVKDDFYLIMPRDLLPIAKAALNKYAPFFKAELTDANGKLTLAGLERNTPFLKSAATIPLPKSERAIALLDTPVTTNADYNTWHHLNILQGIPSLYAKTSGEFLPHDFNLPQLNAVSFTKGCYTGQEIIARMHYRGNPKNHLYRGLTRTLLQPGTLLYINGNQAGTIIDCSETVYNNHYALLFVASEASVHAGTLTTEQGQLIEPQLSE